MSDDDNNNDAGGTMAMSKRGRVDDASGASARPWVEKYRPKVLDDVQAQDEVVNALRTCLRAGANMPHLLFHGPAGTGKTSSILAVAHELFGPDYFRSRVKELNASDDRGIAVVRDKVKKFAQGSAAKGRQVPQSDGRVYPVPAFKLIILDEADALLPDAQAALRRMMEDFSEVTRFCILCNYVSRIIDPITSRCAKFRFKALTKDTMNARIHAIASREGLKISDDTVQQLDRVAMGDLRLAIMYLQSASKVSDKDLTKADFIGVSGSVPARELAVLTDALVSGNFARIQMATTTVVRQGFPANQIVTQLHQWLMSPSAPFTDIQRAQMSLRICEAERALFDRGDDHLVLLALGSHFVTLKAAAAAKAQ